MRFWYLFLILTFNSIFSQETTIKNSSKDLIEKDSIKIFNPTWEDYKYQKGDEGYAVFDSIFTIKKLYQHNNYTQKDSFGKLLFANIGQAFQPLFYENTETEIEMIPFGKSISLLKAEDVRYFNVKTPTTQFLYNNGFKEGHSLRTTFTHNITPRWNYAVEYHGLRSLGKYLRELASTNTIILSSNYHTKNNRYFLKLHYLATNVNNEENGGISITKVSESVTKSHLDEFIENNPDFRERNRLSVNLSNALSKYHTRRYFIEQQFGMISAIKSDSTSYYPISLKNTTFYQWNEFNFGESSSNVEYFGSNLVREGITLGNTKNFTKFSTSTLAVFDWNSKLKFEGGIRYENLNFYFGQDYLINENLTIPSGFQDHRLGGIGKLKATVNQRIHIDAEGNFSTGSFFKSTFALRSNVEIIPLNDYKISGSFNIKSLPPNLNFIAHQSYYQDFNYYLKDFKNELTTEISAKIALDKFKTSAQVKAISLSNFAYFNQEGSSLQAENPISILQFQVFNTLKYKHFYLDSRVAFQQVDDAQNVLPLPKWILRTALYYQNQAFKNKATLQTGIKLYYFSKYNARTFNPIYNEFMLSSSNETIGSYPIGDLFVNLKVKRMQIFLEFQHLNSSFSKDFRVDPLRPYADFRLNVGVNWLIFN